MDNQDTSASVYSEAKSEYTKQLVFNFLPVEQLEYALAILSTNLASCINLQLVLFKILPDKQLLNSFALFSSVECIFICLHPLFVVLHHRYNIYLEQMFRELC